MPLVSLTQWMESAWACVLGAGPERDGIPVAQLDDFLDGLITENASLRVNGAVYAARNDFKTFVIEHREQWEVSHISFSGTLECLEDVSRGAQAGEVGTTFVAHCNHRKNHQFALDIRVCAITTVAWTEDKAGEDKRQVVALTMVYVEVPLSREQ
ncbi:hypothetical protein AURDEDRAFT_188994 [Auricularia subglabra TFB-10046 SS5]|nr:hypothetical protein AURDEDRAFT_188994 [Auricularia subglabra TFB-10046 SS5]